MKQSDRHARILQELRLSRFRSVVDLAATFEVSEETIRRDLRRLEESGEVEKVHGGVMLRDQGSDAPFQSRVQLNLEAKTRIARRLSDLVPDGATIFIDGGSTCCVAAKALVDLNALRIVTISTEVARLVAQGRGEQRITLAPGELDAEDLCVYGADTARFLSRFRCGFALLSASAIDERTGFLDFKPREAELKRVMIANADRAIVMADGSKFGRKGFATFAAFDEVHTLLTDTAPTGEIAAQMSKAGVTTDIAPE